MWKVKVAMSVLIDKSVCPHASGQQTAMNMYEERGRRARARGRGGLAGWHRRERTGWRAGGGTDRLVVEDR